MQTTDILFMSGLILVIVVSIGIMIYYTGEIDDK